MSNQAVNHQVRTKRRNNYLTWLSLGLIALVITVEISLACTFPVIIRSRQQWSEEITRQRLLAFMDQIRIHCQESNNDYSNDINRETLQIMVEQLDDLTLFLRANVEQLNVNRLLEFEDDLQYLSATLDKLDMGKLYPAEVTIDTEKYLHYLLDGTHDR